MRKPRDGDGPPRRASMTAGVRLPVRLEVAFARRIAGRRDDGAALDVMLLTETLVSVARDLVLPPALQVPGTLHTIFMTTGRTCTPSSRFVGRLQ